LIDIRDEIDNAPIGAYHRLLLLLVGLAVFFDGYDTFNASYVIHYVMKPWGMLPGQAGFMVSSGLIGFSTAALLQGKFSDRYGRRPVMLFGLWVMTIFSFCTAVFAHSFAMFCVFRFLTGLGLGILLPLGVTYVNESAPKRVKSTFSTWGWGLGFSLGGATAAVVGVYLTPSLGWQALYYVASLSVFLAITCQAILPESIQFLAMRGSNHKAVAALLSRLNPARADVYNEPGARFIFPEESSRAASVSLLLSPRYRRTTLACWGAAFFVLFGIYGLTGWVPTAMLARGETFAASFGYGALILMMNFVGTLAYSYFADRRGQGRAALVVWWIAGAIAAAILAVVNIHVLNVLCVGAAGFCILGGQGGLNNMTAIWYDTEVRGTAVGMMLGFGRVGGTLGPYVTGLLQQAVPGTAILFVAISVAALLGACLILLVKPQHAVRFTEKVEAV
jgi:AAHS family 4-hydroxybenzoate transporter-like MFS transporter